MKDFIAIIEGLGEGCDYTIGCNNTWKLVRAENEDQVRDIILKDYEELEGSASPCVDGIILYEVSPGSNTVYTNLAERSIKLHEAWENNSEEMKERREYERLKKKYGEG